MSLSKMEIMMEVMQERMREMQREMKTMKTHYEERIEKLEEKIHQMDIEHKKRLDYNKELPECQFQKHEQQLETLKMFSGEWKGPDSYLMFSPNNILEYKLQCSDTMMQYFDTTSITKMYKLEAFSIDLRCDLRIDYIGRGGYILSKIISTTVLKFTVKNLQDAHFAKFPKFPNVIELNVVDFRNPIYGDTTRLYALKRALTTYPKLKNINFKFVSQRLRSIESALEQYCQEKGITLKID